MSFRRHRNVSLVTIIIKAVSLGCKFLIYKIAKMKKVSKVNWQKATSLSCHSSRWPMELFNLDHMVPLTYTSQPANGILIGSAVSAQLTHVSTTQTSTQTYRPRYAACRQCSLNNYNAMYNVLLISRGLFFPYLQVTWHKRMHILSWRNQSM